HPVEAGALGEEHGWIAGDVEPGAVELRRARAREHRYAGLDQERRAAGWLLEPAERGEEEQEERHVVGGDERAGQVRAEAGDTERSYTTTRAGSASASCSGSTLRTRLPATLAPSAAPSSRAAETTSTSSGRLAGSSASARLSTASASSTASVTVSSPSAGGS